MSIKKVTASNRGLISEMMGWPLLSERKTKPAWAVGKSGHVSTKYWNYPLLSDPPKRDSAVGKSGHVSTGFWKAPLLQERKTPPTHCVGKSEHVSTKYWSGPLLVDRKTEPKWAVGKSRLIMS